MSCGCSRRAPGHCVSPNVVKDLGLSTDQVAKINRVIPRGLFALGPDPTAKPENDCFAFLTDEQTRKWTDLCGKKFTFSRMTVLHPLPQPQGGGIGWGMFGAAVSNLRLLAMREVPPELNVTPDQQTRITALIDESEEKIGQIQEKEFDFIRGEDPWKFAADREKKIEEVVKASDDKLRTILNAAQSKRLHELQLQRMAASALLLPNVVKDLGLGTDQVQKIKETIKGAVNGFTIPAFDPKGSQEERMKTRIKKIQDQASKVKKDCVAVLTDEQTSKWTDLRGEKFTFRGQLLSPLFPLSPVPQPE